ncbi:glucuronyl hydrolase [Raphidocelis subcapitata]|uniref:Glucuronyl hydrolase n=1 Tax=Raphidocelis subcapitata TaxID=307507 RepID=A0A2V0PD82_9CHLO|nr:glucuronyl hydrolase [Raphidocelis subcapitata]|eukprot:GBF95055.1 glucuronyl hydrolase [Raphidocelis subcapitata]
MAGSQRAAPLLRPQQLVFLGLLLLLYRSPALAAKSSETCGVARPCSLSAAGCDAEVESYKGATTPEIIARVLAVAEAQARATVKNTTTDQFPYTGKRNVSDGWTHTSAHAWTSGFFPGVLWQLHNLTGRAEWREQAERWTRPLANLQRDWALQHDFGFVYLPSFGEMWKATKSEEAKKQVLAAAEATAWAFNPATNSTRTFEGWDAPGATGKFRQAVIMDHMVNIEVLIEGARLGGPRSWLDDSPDDWIDMAVRHARTVRKNHVRPDGSTYHVVEYHPVRGTVNKRYTYQGYADNSTWSRGQSWAMLGFATMYAATRLPEFRLAAEFVGEKWLSLLEAQEGPASGQWIPKWDFNSPHEPEHNGPLDTSAAAVAALAFLKLAEADPSLPSSRRYLCAAVSTLRALGSDENLATPSPKGGPLLLHATANRPSNLGLDVGLVFGDYYLLEALEVCRRVQGCARPDAAAGQARFPKRPSRAERAALRRGGGPKP